MQHSDRRAEGLQAVGDAAEASSADGGLLQGHLPRRYAMPLLLQEIPSDPFAWNQRSPCGEAPCQVRALHCCQMLACELASCIYPTAGWLAIAYLSVCVWASSMCLGCD
ncbi:unnamed protein product [Linum tenue]|uniref:Uncharacterized protein n=1 Tax=Linum tenue TaxID=586396 RepID=A0AAV0IRP3_9ROSI|nr:unnamed protein product [Linum tenue]